MMTFRTSDFSPLSSLSGDIVIPVNEVSFFDTGGGMLVVSLPGGPSMDDFVTIMDKYGTFGQYPLTILGNGYKIVGSDSLVVDVKDSRFSMLFDGKEWTSMIGMVEDKDSPNMDSEEEVARALSKSLSNLHFIKD